MRDSIIRGLFSALVEHHPDISSKDFIKSKDYTGSAI